MGPRENDSEGGGRQSCAKRMNAVGGGDINNVESSGPSQLVVVVMAEASTRLPSGDVEAGAIFESGSYYCPVGISAGGHGGGEVAGISN